MFLSVNVSAQQPGWSATGALGAARSQHTATLLTDGKVLVAGGIVSCTPMCQTTDTTELYDPATGMWSKTGTLPDPLGNHAAVRLQNGKVLVIGGYSRSGVLLRSANLYDPATGAWTPTGNLSNARQFHTAVLLPNGKVLVTGGLLLASGRFTPTNTAELYDPATGMWSNTGAMNVPRQAHTMTLLASGKVLVATGSNTNLNAPPFLTPVKSCELYDPATGVWTLTGELALPRTTPTATLLPSGKVLLAGGTDNNTSEDPTNKAELYDPASGQWSATGNMTAARDLAADALLSNGKVLLAGGYGNQLALLKAADLYDPATGTWSAASEIGKVRVGHTATLLNNGKVLVAAGYDDFDTAAAFTSAELYTSDGATVGALASVSAASFAASGPLAPESIVAAFGTNLATSTVLAPGTPLPTQLAGVTVKVKDSAGAEQLAPLFFVSPGQINYLVPAGLANGPAMVTVAGGAGALAAGSATIAAVAPGLFSANASGQGVAAAVALRIKAGGAQSFEPVAGLDSATNRFVAVPIDLGPETDQVFLVLYGTGIKFRSALSAVVATIGGASSEVLFASAAPGFVGLDQANLRIPRTLAGRGEVDVALSVDGKPTNLVRVNIR
ncbi:MAG: kelch repeat-containing protein [Blastocatellia bacterium]